MSSPKMRADFEDAYTKQFKCPPQGWSDVIGRYIDAHTQGAWWGWQTATPKAFGDGWCAAMEKTYD